MPSSAQVSTKQVVLGQELQLLEDWAKRIHRDCLTLEASQEELKETCREALALFERKTEDILKHRSPQASATQISAALVTELSKVLNPWEVSKFAPWGHLWWGTQGSSTLQTGTSSWCFKHDGHCASGWIPANSRQATVDACAARCRSHHSCGFFAYSETQAGNNCALYTLAGGCTDDDRYPMYDAYYLTCPFGHQTGGNP